MQPTKPHPPSTMTVREAAPIPRAFFPPGGSQFFARAVLIILATVHAQNRARHLRTSHDPLTRRTNHTQRIQIMMGRLSLVSWLRFRALVHTFRRTACFSLGSAPASIHHCSLGLVDHVTLTQGMFVYPNSVKHDNPRERERESSVFHRSKRN